MVVFHDNSRISSVENRIITCRPARLKRKTHYNRAKSIHTYIFGCGIETLRHAQIIFMFLKIEASVENPKIYFKHSDALFTFQRNFRSLYFHVLTFFTSLNV